MQALEPEVQGQIWGLLYTALCALDNLLVCLFPDLVICRTGMMVISIIGSVPTIGHELC